MLTTMAMPSGTRSPMASDALDTGAHPRQVIHRWVSGDGMARVEEQEAALAVPEQHLAGRIALHAAQRSR